MTHKNSRTDHRQKTSGHECIFCGSPGPLTKEHVFGNWLRQLGYTGEGIREYQPPGGGESTYQRGGPFNKTLKIVCRPCNSEWMSGMENAAKPFLTAMFDAPNTRVNLGVRAQHILSQWAFKTACVASQVNGDQPVPRGLAKKFRLLGLPPHEVDIRLGIVPVVTDHQGRAWLGEVTNGASTVEIELDGQRGRLATFRVTFRLLNVVCDVVGYYDDSFRAEFEDQHLDEALLRIWPIQQAVQAWPPPVSLSQIGGIRGLRSSRLNMVITPFDTTDVNRWANALSTGDDITEDR